jgi:hypothetical protein
MGGLSGVRKIPAELLAVVTPMMMAAVPATVIAIGVSRVGNRVNHKASGKNRADDNRRDHQPVGATRCWRRNRASSNHCNRTQAQECLSHDFLQFCLFVSATLMQRPSQYCAETLTCHRL